MPWFIKSVEMKMFKRCDVDSELEEQWKLHMISVAYYFGSSNVNCIRHLSYSCNKIHNKCNLNK